MHTNMTIFKYKEYYASKFAMLTTRKWLSRFVVDESYSFNLNQINTVLGREIKNTPLKDGKSTQTMTKSQEHTKEDWKYLKTAYLTKREKEKTI